MTNPFSSLSRLSAFFRTQGCRLVSTEDIPYLGSLSVKKGGRDAGTSTGATSSSSEVGGPIPLFDPVVVELNATILLRFLQVNKSTFTRRYLSEVEDIQAMALFEAG